MLAPRPPSRSPPTYDPHSTRCTAGCHTSRDFVPWRFSDAGRRSAWIASSCRRPKTCTEAEVHPMPIGTKSSARVQPIIIGCKAPKFLKSLSGNLADFRPQKGTQFGRGPRVSVGRCRCFPQDFYKRFSGIIKRKLHLLFCKQRRRKHETHDSSISLCVRALQYVRACENGSS